MLRLTVISVDDGLLRTSTGCAGPSSSLTLYVDLVNMTVATIEIYTLSLQGMYTVLLTSRINNLTSSSSSIANCSIFS